MWLSSLQHWEPFVNRSQHKNSSWYINILNKYSLNTFYLVSILVCFKIYVFLGMHFYNPSTSKDEAGG